MFPIIAQNPRVRDACELTETDVLGHELMLVGVDEPRHTERKRAVSDFVESVVDFCRPFSWAT